MRNPDFISAEYMAVTKLFAQNDPRHGLMNPDVELANDYSGENVDRLVRSLYGSGKVFSHARMFKDMLIADGYDEELVDRSWRNAVEECNRLSASGVELEDTGHLANGVFHSTSTHSMMEYMAHEPGWKANEILDTVGRTHVEYVGSAAQPKAEPKPNRMQAYMDSLGSGNGMTVEQEGLRPDNWYRYDTNGMDKKIMHANDMLWSAGVFNQMQIACESSGKSILPMQTVDVDVQKGAAKLFAYLDTKSDVRNEKHKVMENILHYACPDVDIELAKQQASFYNPKYYGGQDAMFEKGASELGADGRIMTVLKYMADADVRTMAKMSEASNRMCELSDRQVPGDIMDLLDGKTYVFGSGQKGKAQGAFNYYSDHDENALGAGYSATKELTQERTELRMQELADLTDGLVYRDTYGRGAARSAAAVALAERYVEAFRMDAMPDLPMRQVQEDPVRGTAMVISAMSSLGYDMNDPKVSFMNGYLLSKVSAGDFCEAQFKVAEMKGYPPKEMLAVGLEAIGANGLEYAAVYQMVSGEKDPDMFDRVWKESDRVKYAFDEDGVNYRVKQAELARRSYQQPLENHGQVKERTPVQKNSRELPDYMKNREAEKAAGYEARLLEGDNLIK